MEDDGNDPGTYDGSNDNNIGDREDTCKNRYQILFNNMVQGVYYQSADGMITDCNNRVLEIFGVTREEFMETRSMDPAWKVMDENDEIVPEEKIPPIIALRTGEPQIGIELSVYNPIKDRIVWFLVNAIPRIRVGEKKPFEVFVTIEDITQNRKDHARLKEIVKELDEMRNYLKDVDSIIEEAFWIRTTDDILYVSNSIKKIYGIEPQELKMEPTRILDYVLEEDKDRVKEAFKSVDYRENGELEIEFRIKSGDGKIKWINSSNYLIGEYDGQIRFAGVTRDITERKIAELELEKAKNFSEKLMDTANAIIVLLDKDGTIISFNQFAEKLTGYNRSDVIGRNWTEIFIPEKQRSEISDVFLDVFEEKENFKEIVNPIITKTGQLQFIRWSNTTQKGPDGKVNMVLSIGVDVTEEILAQRSLKDSEERFRSLFQYSPVGIALISLDQAIIEPNSEYCSILGYERDEIIGKALEGLTLPEDWDAEIRDKLSSGEVKDYSVERRMIRKDGEIVTCRISKNLIRDANGEPAYLIGIMIDITGEKNARRELDHTRSMLEKTLNNLADSVTLVNKDLEFEVVNESHLELLRSVGITEDPIGKNLFDVQPFLHDTVRDEYRAVIERGRSIRSEDSVEINGNVIRTRTIKIPILWNNEVEHIITVIRDISEEEEAKEELIRERERAELYLDLLGHDIGNLHQGIQAGFQLARSSEDPRIQNMGFDSTDALIRRSIKLVKNVLLLSRLKEREANLEPIDVKAVIMSVVGNARKMFPKKDPQFDLKTLDENVIILAEPLVEEIFLNLIHNGIKFQRSEDPIIEIEVRKENDNARVVIADHGSGIPDDSKEKIFSRFTPKGKGSQTGIGLSLVKALTERYDGRLEFKDRIEGDYSRGLLVEVILPLANDQ